METDCPIKHSVKAIAEVNPIRTANEERVVA